MQQQQKLVSEKMLNGKIKSIAPNRLAEDGGYKDKTVLITGATGFLGKVLVEKLLRTCPLVRRVYIIVRAKKGKDPQTRIKELFNISLYDLLKKTVGKKIIEKVVAISGDVGEKDLGLSQDNWKLLADEVEIIINMAATVRFDDPLKKSIFLNTRGTQLLLKLAKDCKNLLVFAHVSTTYCQPQQKVLHEKTYTPPANPNDVIRMAEILDDESVELLTRRLKGNSPNTYTYTKALAEGLVNDEMDSLPVIILRPSVVIPAWLEPIAGWTDSLNGPLGLLTAAGKGVCRTMYCRSDMCAEFIPVDLVANSIMLASYDYMVNKKRRIFNLTTSSRVAMTWAEIIELGKRLVTTKMPLNWVVWYPGGTLQSSRLMHNISVLLFHYIPAVILDAVIILTGNKPVLWKVQQRLTKGFKLLEFYANNEWVFLDNNLQTLGELENETEKAVYKVDQLGFEPEKYFLDCIHSCRLYILKESDESLPTAKRHLFVMWVIDRVSKLLFLVWFGHLLLQYFVYPFLNRLS